MMPFGIFSMPKTSTVSYCPAAMAPAAIMTAAPPLAQPASTSTMGPPVAPMASSTRWPAATPEYAVPQKAAWKPRRSTPASVNAARTAVTPISVTVLPSKRPKGWIPTPATSTAFTLSPELTVSPECPREHGPTLVVGVERHQLKAHVLAEAQVQGIRFGEPGQHANPFGQLDDAEAVRNLAAVAGRCRRHRGPRPQSALAREKRLGNVIGAAVRAHRPTRELVPATARAPSADQPGLGREEALVDGNSVGHASGNYRGRSVKRQPAWATTTSRPSPREGRQEGPASRGEACDRRRALPRSVRR